MIDRYFLEGKRAGINFTISVPTEIAHFILRSDCIQLVTYEKTFKKSFKEDVV